ncbi:MAG: hypothetical protein ACI819_000855 [Neolewinella sp.]|jgi:hypothetical protein
MGIITLFWGGLFGVGADAGAGGGFGAADDTVIRCLGRYVSEKVRPSSWACSGYESNLKYRARKAHHKRAHGASNVPAYLCPLKAKNQ